LYLQVLMSYGQLV